MGLGIKVCLGEMVVPEDRLGTVKVSFLLRIENETDHSLIEEKWLGFTCDLAKVKKVWVGV